MSKIYIPVPLPKSPLESLGHSDSDGEDGSDDAKEYKIYVFCQDDGQSFNNQIQLPEELCNSLQLFETDFDEQNELFFTEFTFRCSHILIKHVDSDVPSSWRNSEITITRKDAYRKIRRVRHLISTGEVNFNEAARCISDCCSARHNGDLNIFQLGQTFPEFELVLLTLKINNLSRVFETQAGFHIVLRTSLEPELSGRQGRKREMVTVNEKVRARKHMKKKNVRFNLSMKHKSRGLYQQSDQYFAQCRKTKRHRKPRKTKTEEEERIFNLKMYEKQQRRIEECLLSKTPLDDEIYKELTIDEPLQAEKSEEPTEPSKPIPLKSVGNAIDLLRSHALSMENTFIVIPEHFLTGPKIKRKKSHRFSYSPFEFKRNKNQTEKWQPPDLYKNVHSIWKRKEPVMFTPSDPETKNI